MSAHVLHMTVVGRKFDAIEAEVAKRIAAYTGWDAKESAKRVEDFAVISCRPLDNTHGVRWIADVEVSV